MSRNVVHPVAVGLCSLALLTAVGCVIAADALNPAFFSGLGLDPGTIFPPTGVVIVAFTNYTSSPAVFYAFESPKVQDLTGARSFYVAVDPGQTRNEVLECPVGLLSPGSLGEDYSVSSVAATVIAAGADVAYNGSALVGSSDFVCGDVIDIALSPAAGENAYLISVRVLPGQ